MSDHDTETAHDAHHEEDHTSGGSDVVSSWKTFFAFACVACFVIWAFGHCGKKSSQQEQSVNNTTTSATVVRQTQTVVLPANTMTPQTFDIPVECLAKYLHQGWKSYPKGGPVEIRNSTGRLIATDTPGVDLNIGYQPDGLYTFCPKPAGSERGVQIYDTWR